MLGFCYWVFHLAYVHVVLREFQKQKKYSVTDKRNIWWEKAVLLPWENYGHTLHLWKDFHNQFILSAIMILNKM